MQHVLSIAFETTNEPVNCMVISLSKGRKTLITIRRQCQASDCVVMSNHRVQQFVLAQVVHFDHVFDATDDHLIGALVERDRQDLVTVLQVGRRLSLSHVPDFRRAIVAARGQHVWSTPRRCTSVHNVHVSLQLLDPGAGQRVPVVKRLVCARREQVVAIVRELQVQN